MVRTTKPRGDVGAIFHDRLAGLQDFYQIGLVVGMQHRGPLLRV
ncbi:MAG TPA: hypothetical protein VLO30_07135 [Chthoniobacterales bacterium]|nr:hypothetical protein [Chthoniobacterales bacterium]